MKHTLPSIILGFFAPCLGVLPTAKAFEISTQGACIDVASDGTHYLAAIESHATATPSISTRLLGGDGLPLAAEVAVGRTGIAAGASFNGDRYLVTWEDDGLGTFTGMTGWQMWGQFVNRDGSLSDTPFAISSMGIWGDGVCMNAWGLGYHLVVSTKLTDPALGDGSTNQHVVGTFVTADGTVGSEFQISDGYGGNANVAFDGTNFLVVWVEDQYDTEVRGCFIPPGGVPGAAFSVDDSAASSDNPVYASFDGTHWLVTWSDETGGTSSGLWDAKARFIDTSGNPVGPVIQVAQTGYPEIATTVSFDGVNHLASWIEFSSETEITIKGQFISQSGALVGSAFAYDTRAGSEIGGALFGNGRYMGLIIDGSIGDNGFSDVTGTDGVWIDPVGTRPIETWRTANGVSGNFDDPDHDGINNLCEYVLAGPPTTPSPQVLPVVSVPGGVPQVTFTRPYPADATIVVQFSENLIDWEDIGILPENSFTWATTSAFSETGTGATRTVTFSDNSGDPAPRGFVRVIAKDNP